MLNKLFPFAVKFETSCTLFNVTANVISSGVNVFEYFPWMFSFLAVEMELFGVELEILVIKIKTNENSKINY